MLQSFTAYYGHMIAGFEFAALETAYFSSRPGKPANMVFVGSVVLRFIQHPGKQAESALSGMSGLFATHPPIEKRIQILEQF